MTLMDATKPSISVKNLTMVRGGNTVLTDLSFDVQASTMLGILGPSGSGKTTLLQLLAGLLRPTSGCIDLQGVFLNKGDIAYVPQTETINWNFPATVLDVVSMGMCWNLSWLRQQRNREKDRVRICLNQVGLWDWRNAPVTELSGGQRQRVCIARALAQEAKIVMLDEALSGVDIGAQESILELLRSYSVVDKIVLYVTHDLSNLSQRFDKVLCINHHICAYGPPEEAYTPAVMEELYGSHRFEFESGQYPQTAAVY